MGNDVWHPDGNGEVEEKGREGGMDIGVGLGR
jgi:hypothetical protein